MSTRRRFIQNLSLSALGLYAFKKAQANSFSPLLPPVNDGKPLRVALMGLGGYANRVATSMQFCKRAKITGLISGTPDKLKSWGEKYQVPESSRYNYENFDAIKDNPNIDAVYVITPNVFHHNQTIRSAQAGKHVICEKPLAINAREAREMISICKKYNRHLLVGYRMHFEPLTLEVQRMRQAGELGAIKFFQGLSGFRIGDPNQWRVNKSLAGGGSLMDIGIYAINGCRYMVGADPIWVTAQETKTDPIKFKAGVDETIQFQFGFANGAVASCLSSYNMNHLDRFFLNGEKGFAELQPASSYGPIRGRTHKGPLEFAIDKPQQAVQMDEMAKIILDHEKPLIPVDGEEGWKDMVIIDAIYKAVASGKKTRIQYS